MSESVFDKLLGSYSGMRKRTWQPAIIEEALDDEQTKQYNAVFAAVQQALNQLAPGKEQAGFGDRKNITITKDPTGQGFTISGSNLGRKKFRDFSREFSSRAASTENSKVRAVMSAWSPKEDGEKKGDEKSKETPADVGTPQEPQGFEKTQRDDIAKYIEQKTDSDPSISQKLVQKIQDTILTPLSRSKMATLFTERPDISPEIQSQLFSLVGRFFSMAGKVEKVTLADDTEVKIIRAEQLSPGERSAGKVITVRGNNGNGGVSFGRGDGELIEEYKDVQTFARAYDHKTYGFQLGKNVSQFGPNVFDARILPEGVDVTAMTKEEFDKLDLVAQKSVSTAASTGDNDTTGKLFEDMLQLGGAIMSNDTSGKAAALTELKTRLEKLGEIGNVDMLNLGAALLSGEMDDLESIMENAPNMGEALKSQIRMMGRQIAKVNEVLGIKSINKSERPSTGSKIGFRTDNRYVISDENPLNPEYRDAMNPAGEGEYRVEISAKQIKSPTETTALGSNKVENALGGDTEEYDKLHEEHLARAVASGDLSEAQAQSCRDALTHDREVYDELRKKFGDLTKPNKSTLESYYNSLIRQASGQFTDTKTQMQYVKFLEELKGDLKKDVNPRQAAMKLLQLHRMRKAATDKEYAAGMFVNDAILSMGSSENEVIVRGSPVDVAMAKTHQMITAMAVDAFADDFEVSVGLASVSLKKDKTTYATNRVAGKENKQFAEGRMTNAGKRRYFESHPI